MPAGVTYDSIATTSPTGVSTVTFSSLGTYTDLRLVIHSTSSTGTSAVRIRFNSDTAANYNFQEFTASPSSVTSLTNTNQTFIAILGTTGGMSSTIPAMMQVDVMSYRAAIFKTVIVRTSNDKGDANARLENMVGHWRSTSAITSLTVLTNSGNFTDAVLSLYGITAA